MIYCMRRRIQWNGIYKYIKRFIRGDLELQLLIYSGSQGVQISQEGAGAGGRNSGMQAGGVRAARGPAAGARAPGGAKSRAGWAEHAFDFAEGGSIGKVAALIC